MEWNQLLSSKRLGEKSEKSPTNNRSPFESDIDRIIFSGSFRRLSRKTQVHPLAPNDHVHTRLTHSLEVAQVGKALGKKLGIEIKDKLPKNFSPDDMANIVQAACLAHDLGNPPFGHAGESAITHWFEVNSQQLFRSLDKHIKKDLSVFEGNAQGFRILTQTENHLFDGGLRLTYACLGTFLKYPWSSRISKDKFGAYITEENILTSVAKELGLIKKGEHEWCRHPLAYLVEAADDICYAVLDLEDAVELGILKFDQVSSLLLEMFDVNEQNIIKKNFGPENAFRVNLARIRSPVFDKVASEAILSFMSNYDKIMAGSFNSELFQEDGNGAIILKAKKMARKNIFKDQKNSRTLGSAHE